VSAFLYTNYTWLLYSSASLQLNPARRFKEYHLNMNLLKFRPTDCNPRVVTSRPPVADQISLLPSDVIREIKIKHSGHVCSSLVSLGENVSQVLPARNKTTLVFFGPHGSFLRKEL
jgi:hypothetical protein